MTVTHTATPAPIDEGRTPAGAVLSRLSKLASEHKRLTVAAQEATGEAHAKAAGVPIVARYAENGVSGYERRKRPDLDEFLAAVERGEFTHVYMRALDRNSRRLGVLGRLIDSCADVSTWIVLDGKAYHPLDDTLQLAMLAGMAKQESVNIKRRGAPARVDAIKARRYLGGPTFGYRAVEGARPGMREQHPAVAEAVRDAYRMILDEGRSTIAVAEEWNRREVPHYGDRAGDTFRPWTASQVGAALLRPLLAGRFVHGGEDLGDVTMADGSPWPSIVTRDEQATMAARLRSRSLRPVGVPTRTPDPAVLLGLATCAECGHAMRSQVYRDPAKRSSYVCHRNGGGGCGRVAVNLDALDEFVIGDVLAAVESAKWRKILKAKRSATRRTGEDPDAIRVEQDQLNEARKAGRLSMARYLDLNEELEGRLTAAIRAEATTDDHAAAAVLLARGPVTRDVFDAAPADVRRAFLAVFVERVDVQRAGRGNRYVKVEDRATIVWRA
jgi:DNA invertase Pin-like site-specific DNA recombinase